MRRPSARGVVALSLGAIMLGTMLAQWVNAQQTGTPAAPRASPNYIGQTSAVDQTGMLAGRRRFEAGARSSWHTHPGGQLIFIESGRARVQRRGQPLKELAQGDSDFTGPNVAHWHGAAPDAGAVQASLSFGGIGPWLEPVTNDEYLGR